MPNAEVRREVDQDTETIPSGVPKEKGSGSKKFEFRIGDTFPFATHEVYDRIIGVRNSDGPALVKSIDPELIEERPAAERIVDDLIASYAAMLNSVMQSHGISGDRATLMRQIAERNRGIYVVMAARAENPAEALSILLTDLTAISDGELLEQTGTSNLMILETARTDAERQEGSAQNPQEAQQAQRGVVAAGKEIAQQRLVIDTALGRKTDKNVLQASSAGFVELLPSPLYQKGAKAVRERIANIEAELQTFDAKPDSERTPFDELQANMLWEERKRHIIAVQTLEQFENLNAKLEKVDARMKKHAEKFAEEKTTQLRSIIGKIGNRTMRINSLNAVIDELDRFISYWKNRPQEKDAERELVNAGDQTVDLRVELNNLRSQEQALRDAKFELDFDPETEITPEKTALYTHLIDLALDGSGEVVADFIQGRLEHTDISKAERDILEQALTVIDKEPWTQPRENPLGLHIGDAVNVELGNGLLKLKHEIIGFTPDNRIIVRNEAGNTRTFDSEFIVKLDPLKSKETRIDAEGMSPGLSKRDTSLMKEALEGPATKTEQLTAKEQGLEINDLRAIRDVFTSMRELLQAGGFSAELEELPKSWNEFLNAEKNKGVLGWLKNRLGIKSEQEKMIDKIMEVYNNRQSELLNVQAPEQADEASRQHVRDAVERMRTVKPPVKFIMPGSIS